MAESAERQLGLRGTSSVSLHQRFSQVLLDQLSCSRTVTFDPAPQQSVRCRCPALVLLAGGQVSLRPSCKTRDPSVRAGQQRLRGRRSVWTRLGGQPLTGRCLPVARVKGFWSFRNKYRWRAGLTCSHRRPADLRRRLLLRRNVQRPSAEPPMLSQRLGKGRPTTSRGCGPSRNSAPTRKQLDTELDEYMSMSRSRLDKQLDDYMSMSRRRLDAQLDDYMSMAGQTDLHWDGGLVLKSFT